MPSKDSSPSTKSAIALPVNRLVKAIIRRALTEDLGVRGDITTQATVPANQKSKAVIIAKSPGIIAGQAIACEVFKSLDKKVGYNPLVADGESVDSGTVVARISGPTAAILSGERSALNLLGRCSGIATLTGKYANLLKGTSARVCETRKTAPGLRFLDKASVRTGGGVNHRYALYDAFLIKENHVTAAGGIDKAIRACRESEWGRKKLKVMVEVRNQEEFVEALEARPDRIMFDNMTPQEISVCRQLISENDKPPELEATGGITLENLRAYGEAGVDFISIGALTHSVKVLDLSLLLD